MIHSSFYLAWYSFGLIFIHYSARYKFFLSLLHPFIPDPSSFILQIFNLRHRYSTHRHSFNLSFIHSSIYLLLFLFHFITNNNCVSFYIFIYPSIHIYLHLILSPYLPICLSIYLYIYHLLSIYISIYLSMFLSIDLSIYLSIYLYIYPSIYLFIFPSIYVSIYLNG